MVSTTQKKEIERIIGVFKEYISQSPCMDVLWSDKVGYMYLDIDKTGDRVNDCSCAILKDGEDLIRHLVSEIRTDVALYNHREEDLGPLEIAEIKRRLAPYISALPEYAPVLEDEN